LAKSGEIEIREAAKLLILWQRGPGLNLRATQLDAGGRAVDIAVYRIQPEMIDGRKTV